MTRSPTPTDEWPEPVRLVCLVALVATHGLVRLTERYLPEFLAALGYGPILVGAVLTLGVGVAVAATNRERASSGPDDRSVAGLVAVLTALGLLVWTGAPALDSLFGVPIPAIGWLAVGVALVQAWYVRGPVRRLWPTDTRIVGLVSSASDRRRPVVAGGLGVAGAAAFAAAAVASAGSVRAGFALLTATGGAIALVAAISLGVLEADSIRLLDRSRPPDTAAAATAPQRPSVAAIRGSLADLPDRRRWTVVGDALVRVAILGSSPYLILLLVDSRQVALSVGTLSLAPAAAFGLFVLAEAAGAIAGSAAAPGLDSAADPHTVLTIGLAALSLIPMLILVAPPSAGVVAALFALLGCRTAIEPLRPTVGVTPASAADPRPVPGRPVPPPVRTAVRFALVPAPLVGGVLYAVGPIAAFTLATTVGLLGVRELLRALAEKHYG